MAKTHKWIVSQLADDRLHLSYTGSGASFEAPDPSRATMESILDFFLEKEISTDAVVRFGLRFWIESQKRTLASGGEYAIEAKKLRDLAKAIRKGEITPELSWLIDSLR